MEQENMWKIIRDNNFEVNDEINAELLCAICHKILINACNNARCGCRYCNGCITEYLRKDRKACPGESEYCDKNQFIDIDKDLQIDQPINIKISKLSVKCPNISCQSKIELKSMENHIRMCVKRFLCCPYNDLGCKENKLTNEEVIEHLSTEIHPHTKMLMEWIIDSQSNSESLKRDMDQLRNDNNDLKEKMKLSEERLKNQNEDVERLKLNNNDIKEKVTKTENIIRDLQKNEKENTEEIHKLGDEMSALKNDNRFLKGELKTLKIQIAQYMTDLGLRPQVEKQSLEINHLRNEMMEMKHENELLKHEMKNIEQIHHSKFTAQIEKLSHEIDELKQCKVEKTQFDDKLEFHNEKINDIDTKFNEISKPFDKIKTQSNNAIESIEKIQEIMEKRNYGEFVWKIDKWDENRMKSKNKTISFMSSDSFFSHKNGYKMCLRAYPDGSGSGKSTHLSIFFYIMKGPFDDFLRWPFKHDVQISLINQQSGIDHTTRIMKCSSILDDEAFIKPIKKKNSGKGFSKFIKLDTVSTDQELSEKNQIFIKCSVKLLN